MEINSSSLIHYGNPPVIEVVCGILFKPLKKMLAPHLGLFWEKFKSQYPLCKEVPPIVPIVEIFPPGQLKEELEISEIPPLPRVWFITENETELIQVQRDRLLTNWRKIKPEDEYPRFKKVMSNFHKCLTQFQEFVRENDIESIVPIQYELTYINHIPKGQGWDSLNEIGKLFPDFPFRNIKGRFLLEPQNINWRMNFPFPDQAGRLHVTIRHGVTRETLQPLISLELNARGFSDIFEKWFDLAHKWIVYGFSDLTELEVQKQIWKRKD